MITPGSFAVEHSSFTGRNLTIAAAILVSLLTSGQSLAATVFEQSPDPGIHAGTSSPLNYYGQTPGLRHADDFTLSTSINIGQIDWWGQHSVTSSRLDDFVFTFYLDAGGLPGSILSQTRGSVISMTDLSIPGLTDYQAVLDESFVALGGIRYWLSIFNASPRASWRWNNSLIGNDMSVYTYVPPDNLWKLNKGFDVDTSFRLVEIPEPVTVMLLGLGGLLLRKRK